ncbi:formyltransferase family protein [Alphaproteobacteria bacterium]|nr:formyltransferase family protein [Alphaproteobacteria bacterium]
MKILIVIDETNFYHPSFFSDLYDKLSKNKNQVFVGLVKKVKKTNSIDKYLLKNILKLNLYEVIFLSLKKIFFKFASFFWKFTKVQFSVEGVLKKFKIKYFIIEYDINKKIYLNIIKNYRPDIIISSCSVIFKKPILKCAKIACINRHTSLLPSYGGVYPVFQSIANCENYCGVTVHIMNSEIDDGKILAQKKLLNEENNLSKIYKNAFNISADLIILAIKNLIKNKFIHSNFKKSYFSFPNDEDWKKFRTNKGRFI